MQHRTLLRTQKNQVFQLLQGLHLDPASFHWSEVSSVQSPGADGIQVSRLDHPATGFYFLFDYHQDRHWTRYSPGKESRVEIKYPGNWLLQLEAASEWLECVKAELEAPDLWAMVVEERQLPMASTSDAVRNEPFNPSEQERIGRAIKELLSYVQKTTHLQGEQLDFVAARLNHLEEAASRLGRKDWITMAVGTLTNIVVGVALAPEAAKDLLRAAHALLGWVVDSFPKLPL